MRATDVLIIVMLFWIWSWDLPQDLPSRKVARVIAGPFLWLGLWHGWAMFAPEPLHVNRRLKAIIRYSDGSVDEWRPVEPLRSNWFIDMLWFRHFKLQFALLAGTEKVLWKPLCQWLVREVADKQLTVASVQLIREYQKVLPPGSAEPLTPWESAVMHEDGFSI